MSKDIHNLPKIWIINQFANTPNMPGGTRHYEIANYFSRLKWDVEVFSSHYLKKLNLLTKYISKEHVTTSLYKSRKIRKVNVLSNPINLFCKIRLVLDYQEDLATINNFLEDYISEFPSDISFDLLSIERIMELPIFKKYYENPKLAPNYKYLLKNSLIFVS